jgi:hypothetical protein
LEANSPIISPPKYTRNTYLAFDGNPPIFLS